MTVCIVIVAPHATDNDISSCFVLFAVVYLCAVNVRKYSVRGDGTAARSISRETFAMDTDNAVRGDPSTEWCSH